MTAPGRQPQFEGLGPERLFARSMSKHCKSGSQKSMPEIIKNQCPIRYRTIHNKHPKSCFENM